MRRFAFVVSFNSAYLQWSGGHGGQFGDGGHTGFGGQHGLPPRAPGLTVASSLAFLEGHCLGASALLLGQQDLAFVSLTAPGLAVSSAFLAADGHVAVLEQEAGEQARFVWQDALDPSTAPGLTSACCGVVEQPISRAAAHRTLAANVVFMGSVRHECRSNGRFDGDSSSGQGGGEGISGHS